jgi:hypothetical protein
VGHCDHDTWHPQVRPDDPRGFVGWLARFRPAFLALAISGVGSQDTQIVRAAYLAMHVTTCVVTKLLLTAVTTIILLLHTQPVERVAAIAAQMVLLWHLFGGGLHGH